MRHIRVIGIGSGNPDHMTIQAIKALKSVDVIFMFDKGAEKTELVEIRRAICAEHITKSDFRIVDIDSPARDATAGYKPGVDAWHKARADLAQTAIGRELGENQSGAFLVWGDPALYDSTLRILRTILANDPGAFTFDVIPGITSIQVLAARHKITLNAIGEPVHITTGRKLAEGMALQSAPDPSTTVVMLDDGSGLESISDTDTHIYWGAYLGMRDEVIISGPTREVIGDIRDIRQRERKRKGWIMDAYLLRREKST